MKNEESLEQNDFMILIKLRGFISWYFFPNGFFTIKGNNYFTLYAECGTVENQDQV